MGKTFAYIQTCILILSCPVTFLVVLNVCAVYRWKNGNLVRTFDCFYTFSLPWSILLSVMLVMQLLALKRKLDINSACIIFPSCILFVVLKFCAIYLWLKINICGKHMSVLKCFPVMKYFIVQYVGPVYYLISMKGLT